MLLGGPFLQNPFIDTGARGGTLAVSAAASAGWVGLSGATVWLASSQAAASFAGTTEWDRMLSDDAARIAYFAEIEPWVLADRS